MRFGKTLKNSVYEPWISHYIDYTSLKKMLREKEASNNALSSGTCNMAQEWTEEDESAFVEELLNVQLEKVNTFQVKTYKELQGRTSRCESALEKIVEDEQGADGHAEPNEQTKAEKLSEVLKELDSIINEINELEKYSRLNFTGFLKAAKKHDRRRGTNYRVRPLLQVRLAALPFNTEDYSPLLYRLVISYLLIVLLNGR